METQDIQVAQSLLYQVSLIAEKYNEFAKTTGENFNIFRILKVEAAEVRMHSAFLAELLNTKGNHGQEDAFLKVFIKEFAIPGFEDVGKIEAEVVVEEHQGFITIDGTQGGRIDIVIKTSHGIDIVIENKIYAGDGEKQLIRYKNSYPNAHLLYLTLYGKDADKQSVYDDVTSKKLEANKDYFPISYEKGILYWLKQCLKEATSYPLLRETITQYVNLIKYLTNQTINHRMETEVVSTIMGSIANLKAAKSITDSTEQIKAALLSKLANDLNADDIVKRWVVVSQYDLYPWEGLLYYPPSWKSFCIYLRTMSDGDGHFGVYCYANSVLDHDGELLNEVSKRLSVLNVGKVQSNSNWVSIGPKYFIWICTGYKDWVGHTWEDIYNGVVKEKLLKTAKNVVALLDGIEL